MSPRSQKLVNPFDWARPKGYSNGVVASGRMLFVAGQVGWDPRSAKPKFPKAFGSQFDQALSNVVAVVREAGGRPDDVARLTIYVTKKAEYVKALKDVGKSWRRHMGRHYPAMALVQVAALLEPAAKVEIEATAVLEDELPAAPVPPKPSPAR